ncbi:RecQ family ATP-dependent DNA helicase [bacterium]|nr:RecQ family ATP-dependent DNA helicase [bacterium]
MDTTNLETYLPKLGLEKFRAGQQDVVEAVVSGSDVMCVMPTGGGKSLCYQLPSLIRPGMTIVISPLIALMKDQVDSLQKLDIKAGLINSSLSHSEQSQVMQRMESNQLDLVYVAPERLRNGRFIDTIKRSHIGLLAVDEAHCVSEWGHDFRPDYARLGQFRDRHLAGIQTIALTATATPTVRSDIESLLGLKTPRVYVTGFSRDNLRFEVTHVSSEKEKADKLTSYLKKQTGNGIIYAATRKRCEEIAESASQSTGKAIGVYHAGLDPLQRQQTQERFMCGELSAIVATNAFGMGIDKSDIRYVVHYNMPGSLEAYYQEAGRAGRDGKPSECLLLFSYSDRYVQEFFIETRYPTKETVSQVYDFLLSRDEDPIELTLEQVRESIGTKDSNEAISTAEQLLGKSGVLKRLDSNSNQAVVRIDSSVPTLLDFIPLEAKVKRRVLQAVESVVGNRRHEDVFTTPKWLAQLADVDRNQLTRSLRELCKLKAFDYVPPFRGRGIHFIERDKTFSELKIDFDELNQRKASEYEKLESVIRFARSPNCRQQVILDYFGDTHGHQCGRCDRCQPNPVTSVENKQKVHELSSHDRLHFLRGLQITMSGVTRMHGRFGKNMVAQMLCGSKNKKLTQWKLHRLSTYGLLSGMKQSEVASVMDKLTEVGLLVQQEIEQRRPTIHMTDLGREVMHGRQPLPTSLALPEKLTRKLVEATRQIEPIEESASGEEQSNSASTLPSTGFSPDDNETNPDGQGLSGEIAESLKRWRRKTSAALGIPAFRVLTNSTLDRLATQQPDSLESLMTIKGIGDATASQYGEDLLQIIRQISDQSALNPNADNCTSIEPSDQKSSSNPKPEQSSRTMSAFATSTDEKSEPSGTAQGTWVGSDAYWSWRLLKDGFSFEEVAIIRRCTKRELEVHLKQAIQAGVEDPTG